MGGFDKQIRERIRSDQSVFEDSFLQIADAVLGNGAAQQYQDKLEITQEALDDILKYYHCKPANIPDGIEDVEE